jgi:hypothetical protein
MTDDKETSLNADAIYAALRWAKNNTRRAEWTAAHIVAARISQRGEVILHPPFNLTPEEIEAIYPDNPVSVDVGLTIGRLLLVAPDVAVALVEGGGPIGIAVRRYLADEEK